MTRVFNKNQKLGEIAAVFPKATETFMKYDIDFAVVVTEHLKWL